MNPLVSVIMSCYNETSDILCEAINSILNQTYSNIEFIIINDNPSNIELKELLYSYAKNPKIILIENKKNLKLPRSLNKAINVANGKYIARMDADDISLPYRIEREVNYLETHPVCALVCSNRDDINERSEIIRRSSSSVVSDKALSAILKFDSIISHPTVLIRTSVLKELHGYRPMPVSEDFDLWLRILTSNYQIHMLPEVLLKYRIRQNSMTRINIFKTIYCNTYIKKLYRERLKFNNKDSFSEYYINNSLNRIPSEIVNTINKQYYIMLKPKTLSSIIETICIILKSTFIYADNIRFLINLVAIKLLIKLDTFSTK